jgi:hypothetical protein
VFEDAAKDERRYVGNIGNCVKLPGARGAIILPVSGIPYPLVLVDDAKRHHDHHIQLADHYADYPLFHQTT